MKNILKYAITGVFACFTMISFSQGNYDALWKEVTDLKDQGLPAMALDKTQAIYLKAKNENNSPQLIKSLLMKISLKSSFEEDFLKKSIDELKSEISTAGEPSKQILSSILAELYWRYYQDNRWKFQERTNFASQNYVSEDIDTWDMKTLVINVLNYYSSSLQNEGLLKSTSLIQYSAILEEEKGSRDYRPTLYDFLVHRAIDFYMNEEPGLIRPAERFEVDDPKFFSSARVFSELQIATKDTLSLKFQAFELFKDILAFHLNDSDPKAFVDADLKRLNFIYFNFSGNEKDSLMLVALDRISDQFNMSPVNAEVLYEKAKILIQQAGEYNWQVSENYRWNYKEAKEVIELAVSKYPSSDGAENCKTLLPSIEQKNLLLTLDQANLPDTPILGMLSYRNIEKVHFRVCRIDPGKDKELRNKMYNEKLVEEYLKLPVEKTWSQELPKNDDHQPHTAMIKIEALSPGYYILLASDDKDFNLNNVISVVQIWSTRISYVNEDQTDGSIEYFVLDRRTGMPLADVKVTAYKNEYDYSRRQYQEKEIGSYSTDSRGFFRIPAIGDKRGAFFLKFALGQDQYIPATNFYPNQPEAQRKTVERTFFFTDRSIYRPGQTIWFKGIILDTDGETSTIVKGKQTTVTFNDANGQKVFALNLTTNEFGSFQGSFTAPTGVLTGQMSIFNESGSVYFAVEEYKRPTFAVDFNPLAGSYKVNDQIKVTGTAKAYAGNSIPNASVKYRVVRVMRFWERYFYYPGIIEQEMEITNGMTYTDKEGNFEITFKAIPDRKAGRKAKPVFYYTVYADVVDISGEVRSSETMVAVGYESFIITSDLNERVCREESHPIKIDIRNLNGERIPAAVTAHVYRLRVPGEILRDRKWGRADTKILTKEQFKSLFPYDVYDNENDMFTWEKMGTIYAQDLNSPKDTVMKFSGLQSWTPGAYVMVITAKDRNDEEVSTNRYFTVYSKADKKMPMPAAGWFATVKGSGEPGEEAAFLIGTSFPKTQLLYEVENKGKIVKREWIRIDNQQRLLEIPIVEDYRGNFTVNFLFIRENEGYHYNYTINVPEISKTLDFTFETFRDKLNPGQEEEWKIKIKGAKGEVMAAEVLAGMYDLSLDAFTPHNWSFSTGGKLFRKVSWESAGAFKTNYSQMYSWPREERFTLITRQYDRLNWFGYEYYGQRWGYNYRSKSAVLDGAPVMGMAAKGEAAEGMGDEKEVETERVFEKLPLDENVPVPSKKEPVKDIPLRTDFKETAFFFPNLKTDEDGAVILNFTMPQSLTRWKFMGFAHTSDLYYGFTEKEVVTQKELMVVPNYPRFMREGDQIDFTTRVINLTERSMEGEATASFFDARTMQPVNGLLKVDKVERSFYVEANGSTAVSWKITVPEGIDALVCRIQARSGSFSDGEEKALAILSNRMMVIESLPLPINGNQTKNFRFEKLLSSGSSTTIKDYRLTLEFTSNPAWYAIQALPYLMETKYESADNIFNRLYANSIAVFVANSNPQIKQVFDTWKLNSSKELLSNLEKNQELKSVLIEESPWVRDAENETERKNRLAILFDLSRMNNEKIQSLKKLREMQLPNGAWPWFESMRENRYVTQLIVTGFGKLDHLDIIDLKRDNQSMSMIRKAMTYLDDEIRSDYEWILKNQKDKKDEVPVSTTVIQYLYARSFLNSQIPLDEKNRPAYDYFMQQLKKSWLKQDLYMQGMIALILDRSGDKTTSVAVMRSIKDRALYSEEMGMYWRAENGYYWYDAPIERQALFVEAFLEITGDQDAVEKMKVWLLKQKQTQDWKTGRATADAVYSLIIRGTDLLASPELVDVTMGYEKIDPLNMDAVTVEAGTGYFKTSWSGREIDPEMGNIKVTKKDEGIAWGAVYWQYFEDLDRITPAKTPLAVEKELFIEENSPTGPVLTKITTDRPLKTGDKVKVRVVIRTDRDMEFVHLKDMRAASFEPVNVLSGFRYQGGLGYYESTKDASTSFFFDYLRKGTYVLEYEVNVTQSGEFSNGITTLQCLYAPEFSAHSQGIRVVVK